MSFSLGGLLSAINGEESTGINLSQNCLCYKTIPSVLLPAFKHSLQLGSKNKHTHSQERSTKQLEVVSDNRVGIRIGICEVLNQAKTFGEKQFCCSYLYKCATCTALRQDLHKQTGSREDDDSCGNVHIP